MENYLNTRFLQESEKLTQETTDSILRGNCEHFPKVIDTLFVLPYFAGAQAEKETNDGVFYSYSYANYAQAPYTFWTIYDLYRKGFYNEGIVLLRHLIETLIQMRYLSKYPEKCTDYLTGKVRIKFKKMFGEFAPEYFEDQYGLLSSIAHGKVEKDIFRFERKSTTEARTIMGCEYNVSHATYLSNYMVTILYGFLNLFDLFFPQNTLRLNEAANKDFMESKSWLEQCMQSHKTTFSMSEKFYNVIDKIIYA